VNIALSPTAYDLARLKQVNQAPAQRKREGQRELKIALGGVWIRHYAPGTKYRALLLARRICEEYRLDVPVVTKWLIALHEAAQLSDHARHDDLPLFALGDGEQIARPYVEALGATQDVTQQ
jgi:hypothetical protein